MTAPVDDAATTDAPPTPGSSLGVFALLCSLLGASGCLVLGVTGFFLPDALLGIPITAVLSLLGFALGVTAYFRAKPPTPRGVAIVATFLGIIVGVTQGALVVGSLVNYLPIKARVLPQLRAAFEETDPVAAGDLLGADALDEVDGQALVDFVALVDRLTGGVTEVTVEPKTLLLARRVMADYQPRADSDPGAFMNAKPLELRYGQGERALLYAWLDEAALKDDRVLFDDLLAFMPDGTIVVLRQDGPANLLAGNFEAPARLP